MIKATAPLRRPGAAVALGGGPGEAAQGIIVALTTLETAQKFNSYFNALRTAAEKAVGILLIHPRRDLALGNNAKTWFEQEQKKGRIRLLALEDHPLTFQALEAFVALLIQAENRELILDGVTMTPEDCRDLVIKTGVIDNIDLFKLLGHATKAAGAAAIQATARGAGDRGGERRGGSGGSSGLGRGEDIGREPADGGSSGESSPGRGQALGTDARAEAGGSVRAKSESFELGGGQADQGGQEAQVAGAGCTAVGV